MNIGSFAEVLADRQGGIKIELGKVYKKELTRNEALKAFGEVPQYTIQYGLAISVRHLESDRYMVTVKREK